MVKFICPDCEEESEFIIPVLSDEDVELAEAFGESNSLVECAKCGALFMGDLVSGPEHF